jgi:hypothetical protein
MNEQKRANIWFDPFDPFARLCRLCGANNRLASRDMKRRMLIERMERETNGTK